MVECPNCGSTRIGRLSVGGTNPGGGNWVPANSDPVHEYTADDCRSFYNNNAPSVEVYVCCVCSEQFYNKE